MDENKIKNMSNLIFWFQIFRIVNFAAFLHKESSKSIVLKYIYYFIPISFFFLNIYNLICNEVFYGPNDKYMYLNDLSNSLCLTLLYFLSYFLSGYYPKKTDAFIQKGIDKYFFCKMTRYSKSKRIIYSLFVITGVTLFVISEGLSFLFYNTAASNPNAYWMNHLDDFGRVCYFLFLCITWYQSLSLLGMALTSGLIVYKTLEYKILVYIEDAFNKNVSIMNAADIVFSTFSYGLFYIVGSFLIIFNDRVAAKKFHVYNTFNKDIPSIILISVITLLVIFVYLPLQELFSFMKKKKDYLISELNCEIMYEKRKNMILKKDELVNQSLIYTTVTNKVIFILSVLIPSVGVIFQIIALFVKK